MSHTTQLEQANHELQAQYEALVELLEETHGIRFTAVRVFKNGQPLVGCVEGLYFLTTTVLPLAPKTMLLVVCEQYPLLAEGVVIDYDEMMRRARAPRVLDSRYFIVDELLLDTHAKVATENDYITVRGEEPGVYQVTHADDMQSFHELSASILMEQYLAYQPEGENESMPQDFKLTFERLDESLMLDASVYGLKPSVYLSVLGDIQSAMASLYANLNPKANFGEWLRKESFKQLKRLKKSITKYS